MLLSLIRLSEIRLALLLRGICGLSESYFIGPQVAEVFVAVVVDLHQIVITESERRIEAASADGAAAGGVLGRGTGEAPTICLVILVNLDGLQSIIMITHYQIREGIATWRRYLIPTLESRVPTASEAALVRRPALDGPAVLIAISVQILVEESLPGLQQCLGLPGHLLAALFEFQPLAMLQGLGLPERAKGY